MDLKVITRYQNWAWRGYHELLSCPNDGLALLVDLDKETDLICCFCNYRKTLGLAEYEQIQQKTLIAQYNHSKGK